MDYKSCIAKRTRAQQDLYLVQLCDKLKMERGEESKSVSPDDPLKRNPSSSCKINSRNRRMDFSVVSKSGLRSHCNHFKDKGGEFDGDANKESGYDSDREFESIRGQHEADDIIDVDNFLFDGDYEVEEGHGGFVGNYYNSENEDVETDGNEDKGAGYGFRKQYESEQGGHQRTEVIDVDKFPFDEFEVEINDKSQSCNAFTEGDEVIDVDKFPFDEFEVEIIDDSQSRNTFDEGCHESDEVIDVHNFPFDNFVVEINDERDAAAKRTSKSIERSSEGDCEANFEKVNCDFSNRVLVVDSDESQPSSDTNNDESDDMDYDESQPSSDTNNDESDDMDYEMEHCDIYAHEESSSSEEGINYVAAKAKKSSKLKVGFGENDVKAKGKKALCKVSKHVPFDCNEDDQPDETEGKECDSTDSGNKLVVCDGKTNSKSKVGFGESSVAATGERRCCKVRKRASVVGSDEVISSSVQRTKDSDGFDFELENSNFLVDASSDKVDHHEETEVEKIYRSGTKVNSHFVESKTCGSYRHTKTRLDDEGNGVTLGGDQIEPLGHKKLGNAMEVDDVLHRSSSYRTQKKVSLENPPKGNEEDSETREQPTKRRRDSDIFRILANYILDEGAVEGEACEQEAKQSCSVVNTLNYKFRFEDEELAAVEKSEIEIEVENLFDEMDFSLKCEEMGSFIPRLVERENPDIPVAEKDQYTLCNEGKHQLIIDDEIGLRCLYCFYVEREIKFIMPEWAKCKGGSDRKRFYGDDDVSTSDGVQFKASGDDSGNSSYHGKGSVWDIIPGIRESMFPHQREGFEFLWKNLAGTTNLGELKSSCLNEVGGCIISHAPGTGKTRLTAMFIQSYLKIFPNCRPVIIAPASMLLTWEEEFRKWEVDFPFHNMNNLDFSGKENIVALNLLQGNKFPGKDFVRMAKLYSWCKGKSILGVSYNLYGMLAGENFIKKRRKKQKKVVQEKKWETELLLDYPGLVVLDEGHTPRNHKSRIWNTLLKLQTEKRIILSGTPFQNNFGELFNTLHLVRPAVADVLANDGSFGLRFKRRCSRTISNGEVSNSAIEMLKSKIAPFVNVHKGSILLESLPGLRDSIILLKPPPLQKSLIESLGGSQYMIEYEYKIALVSIHPSLILNCTLSDKENSIVNKKILEKLRLDPEKGVKTRFLMDFICLSIEKKEKVLIFSQYIPPLELIRDQLEAVFGWNENQVLHMHGKVELKQRQNLITRFNNPKDEAKIMLASTKCCAEGINLVGASRVVLLDVVWNPSVERQAISRAFRLGQKKVVYTYHLMTCGTREGDKYCRQAEKDRLSELVFSSNSKENNGQKNHAAAATFNDEIVDAMFGHIKLRDMFEKIIRQPKVTKLIENFGLA